MVNLFGWILHHLPRVKTWCSVFKDPFIVSKPIQRSDNNTARRSDLITVYLINTISNCRSFSFNVDICFYIFKKVCFPLYIYILLRFISNTMTSAAPTEPPIFSTDMKGLMNQLKDIDLSGTLGRTSELTMDDILHKMSEAKLKAKAEKEAKRPIAKYVPPGGWKQTTSIRKESTSTTLAKLAMAKKSKLHTVAAFRTNSFIKWDGSSTLDPEMEKEIYRTPCRDPSGTFYRNLGREPYKGDKKWKPTSVDSDLPDVTVSMLTDSFRTRLVVHISSVVEKEREVYEHMPIATEAQRNAKARHGADLNNLEMVKADLLDSIMLAEKNELALHEQEKQNKKLKSLKK